MIQEAAGIKESEVCSSIGLGLIAIGLIAGVVFIIVFGRIEVPLEIAGSYFGTKTVWSGTMIATGFGIVLNSFLIGYLFQKIASILRYHENRKIK